MRGRLPYLLLAPVLAGALFLGARGDGTPPTPAERADRIASEVRCPTCRGLSAAESDAPAAEAIRREIRRRVDAGESDEDILAFLVSRYTKDVLLKPEATGVAGLVWALPVAVLVGALGGLAEVLWRRGRGGPAQVSPEDRALVEQALRR